jgi:hypothetical protein
MAALECMPILSKIVAVVLLNFCAHYMLYVLHIKITQLDKCRTCLSLVASVATPVQLVASVASWSQSVIDTVESCYCNGDTKEALETTHLLILKEGNRSIGVKHLLTP